MRAAALRVIAEEELDKSESRRPCAARADYVEAIGGLAWLLRHHALPSHDIRARQLVAGADTAPSTWPEAVSAAGGDHLATLARPRCRRVRMQDLGADTELGAITGAGKVTLVSSNATYGKRRSPCRRRATLAWSTWRRSWRGWPSYCRTPGRGASCIGPRRGRVQIALHSLRLNMLA